MRQDVYNEMGKGECRGEKPPRYTQVRQALMDKGWRVMRGWSWGL